LLVKGPGRPNVRFLDCLHGTPLLDIKRYLPTTDSEPEAAMGWLGPHATRNSNTAD
jgi:tRNA (Thr-GGU) A37 N-methylase